MIVDCHTHIWQSTEQVGSRTASRASRAVRALRQRTCGPHLPATPEQHATVCKPVDAVFVLGLRSRHLDMGISNDLLAQYARRSPERVIGFAGIDPLDGPRGLEEVRRARGALGLRGLVVAPAIQAMHPADTAAMRVYQLAEQLRMPVVFHNSPPMPAEAHLEFARPYLLDEVAREFPNLRILITQMGYPWVDETLMLLARHEHLYAEISGIVQTPWLALRHMEAAYERGVMDKLLFGSDFPYSDPKSTIESLYSLNQIVHGTNLPSVPREQLRGIVERNSPALLGIDVAIKAAEADQDGAVAPSDEVESKSLTSKEPEPSA